MANKTKPARVRAQSFVAALEDETRRADCRELLGLMREITGEPARMWGASIVGFGQYHYKYDSGREGDSFLTGFSPRKQALVIYVMDGFARHEPLMEKLGKYQTGKSCLYVKRLDDIDRRVLRQLVTKSVRYMRKKDHP